MTILLERVYWKRTHPEREVEREREAGYICRGERQSFARDEMLEVVYRAY